MKGLELSESYFNEYAKDAFEGRFGSLMERIAAGLAGPGSECFGLDDEFSRDHDWGPGFCLWVTPEDYQSHGKELQACYDSLSKEFKGFRPRIPSPGEINRVGVIEINGFYKQYTGLNAPPQTLLEWDLPSSNLALCTNGKVFSDPLGRFTDWRNRLLEFYPDDLVLKKIADCCMHAGQAGQYNWQRGLLRNDPFVTSTAKIEFCKNIIQLVYLFNKTYAPYYKLMFAGLKNLPVLGKEIYQFINMLLAGTDASGSEKFDWETQQEIIQSICQKIIRQLQLKKVTDESEPFLIDHVPSILSRVKDQAFKSTLWKGK